LSTGDYEEAAVKQAVHGRAAETVVLASQEKLGAASAFTIASLAEIATLVVPPSTPLTSMKAYVAAGPKVVLAD
jgi:DeoR/GlpR family transcriptional regulator of sugar metabolism